MKSQKFIHRKFVAMILMRTIRYLQKRPTLMDISFLDHTDKFTVCGDTHGQFYDLLNIFKINGDPSSKNPYLFNGDFVDRGSFSVEVILTLFMYQLLHPTGMYLTRGNHETKNMNKLYGFEGEVPLCAVIEKKVFVVCIFLSFSLSLCVCLCVCVCFFFSICLPLHYTPRQQQQQQLQQVHGGIFTQDNVTLDDIRKIKRNGEPPESGPFCDMLWSDPSPRPGRHPSKRGVSSKEFGEDVTKAFLKHNNLDLVVRSHEVKQEGYEVMHDGKCVTIFSAPNYCGTLHFFSIFPLS